MKKIQFKFNLLLGKKNGKIKVKFIIYSFLEKITCSYHFDCDTIDGLVSELFSAVDLNKKDYDIIKQKLSESISKHQQLRTNSFCSTNCESIKQKSKFDEFLIQFNTLFNQIKDLNNCINCNNLDILCKKFETYDLLKKSNNELLCNLNKFKSMKEKLFNFMKVNNSNGF